MSIGTQDISLPKLAYVPDTIAFKSRCPEK